MRALLGASALALALSGALSSAAALVAPAPLAAQEEGTAQHVLSRVEARYAAARTLHATFDGTTSVLGREQPISGRIDWRAPDASRLEIVTPANRMTTVRLQVGDRVRRWIRIGDAVEEQPERTTAEPATLPLIPPFDGLDAAAAAIRGVRNEAGRPSIFDIEAGLTRPIDAFTTTRMGVEDGTWLIRSLELRSDGAEKGGASIALRFHEMKVDEPLPEATFGPPTQRD